MKTKNVTISLTDKQRTALKNLTGQEHGAVVFESNPTALTAKLAPKRIAAKRVAAKRVAAKKVAAKRVAAKRVAAKRVAAKKVAAKRVAARGQKF
jgi:hypothetical protein